MPLVKEYPDNGIIYIYLPSKLKMG